METKQEIKNLIWIIAVFLFAYFLPIDSESFTGAVFASLDLAR